MIDFRYHLVSIVAVFLALTLGLVLGSTVIDNVVLQGAKGQADDLQSRNEQLTGELQQLQGQERSSQGFVKSVAPKLLAGELSGKSVVIVGAPDADSEQVDDLTTGVKQAGATLTGTVSLRSTYTDKGKVGLLGGLTETLVKSTKLDVPTDAVPSERAAYLLASAVVAKDETKLGKTDDSSTGTLSAFKDAKFLTTTGDPAEHASLAILVGPAKKFDAKQASAGNQAMVALAKRLDKAGKGSVLTAPSDSSGPDGVVAALRGDDDAKRDVSTVDNLDAAQGYVVSVLALALEANGKSGQWGSGTGSDGSGPTPTVHPTK